MAITPRTILTSAAPATVAVVSLYFFTVLGTAAFTSLSPPTAPDPELTPPQQRVLLDACPHVTSHFGSDTARWSEFAWIQATFCLDGLKDSDGAVTVASQGLQYYPRSETLHNLKGYHQIINDDHAGAIRTLRAGMENVTHQQSGVMANNLSWAGLWEPRMMRLDEARHLYTQSLARSPGVCETLHTGLFVEFAYAGQAHGLDRYDALQRFNTLRSHYDRCLGRLDGGDWNTAVEIIGAAAIYNHVDTADSDTVQPLMQRAALKVRHLRPGVTAEEVCAEAMPMSDFHHHCVDAVNAGINANRLANHQERNERVRTNREILEQYGHDYPTLRNAPIRQVRVDRSVSCGSNRAGSR